MLALIKQGFMMEEFDAFTRKYQEAFQLGTLFVYMKSHRNTNLKGNTAGALSLAVPNG